MEDKNIKKKVLEEGNFTQNSPKTSTTLQIPDELKSLLADPEISKDKKQLIVNAFLSVNVSRSSAFSGPIPPPEVLKGYNDALTNGAERIISMAEKQSSHRMILEDHAIKEELKQSRLGQIFGFILGVFGMGLAAILAILGHEAIAGIFGTTTIIGLVTVFVLGKKIQQKDLIEKRN